MNCLKSSEALYSVLRYSFLSSRPSLNATRNFTSHVAPGPAILSARRPTIPNSFPRRQPNNFASIRNPQKPRFTSTISSEPATSTKATAEQTPPREPPPSYQISFTCKPCLFRSSHTITKQGYHHGAVLIKCPQCKAHHVISDHLGIFADKSFTVEDLVRRQGQEIKKVVLDDAGDLEFWKDGNAPGQAEAEELLRNNLRKGS